ncbi:MAG: hypothetical protein MUO21_04275 [Nitrososphaeraceae archaeon]|nr:hypothetical protein [Nitrososphaeraceae archaeon]
MSSNDRVIISHGPGCKDGAVSAWLIWRLLSSKERCLMMKLGGFYSNSRISKSSGPYIHPNSPEGAINLQSRGFKVVFVFVQPGTYIPNQLIKDKDVIILDLDMGEILLDIVKEASTVLLIDHHESSLDTISQNSDYLLSKNRDKFKYFIDSNLKESGATLTWKYFYNNQSIHPFIEIIRIGDTWLDNNPKLEAKAVLKALHVSRAFRSFITIEETFQSWNDKYISYINDGRVILTYEDVLVNKAAKQAALGYIKSTDGEMYTVAYTQANILHSEIGARIRKYAEERFKVKIHFCATWKEMPYEDIISVSLRDPLPGIKLSEVVRKIDGIPPNKGGGHIGAAGFIIRGAENRKKIIQPASNSSNIDLPIRKYQPYQVIPDFIPPQLIYSPHPDIE